MNLYTYIKSLPGDAERSAFSTRCETTLGHIRNVMYGYKTCSTELAVSIERESAGAVTRIELCPELWAKRWPELIGAAGSPDVPAPKKSESA